MSLSTGTQGSDQGHSTTSLQQEVEFKLHLVLKLSRTLRKTEVVPRSSRTSLSPSPSPSPNPSRNASAASTRRPLETRTHRGEQPIPRQVDHPAPHNFLAVPSTQDVPSRSEASSRPQSQARNPPEFPASSAASRAGSEAGPSLVVPRSPSIRSEDDFIGFRSSGEGLRIVMSSEHQKVQGRIRYGDEREVDVVAKVEPDQNFNFMTSIRASELGLLDFVQPHEDDDKDTWIMPPSGERIRPDGTIQLRWCPRQSRSIRLQFFVFSGWWERDVVLGAPYVEKEKHYARQSRDRKD